MINLMDPKYESFLDEIKKASKFINGWEKNKKIRIISHFDADGITSASIILKAMERENRQYSLDVVEQLDKNMIKNLSEENFDYFIFTDLGSGQYDDIKTYLKTKKVLILDHHTPTKQSKEDFETKNVENFFQVNPHFFEIDGSDEISGAGVTYLFVKTLNNENTDLAHLALIGAVGDVQTKEGLKTLNKKILDDCLNQGIIKQKKILDFYGLESRPLFKLIAYSSSSFIPGVGGSEASAINFLNQMGIPMQKNGKWTMFNDLTNEEKQKLVAGILIKRAEKENPNDIFIDSYILKNYGDNFSLKDVREFATVLNACGRLNKASLGINLCLKNEDYMKNVPKIQSEYKKEIVKGLNYAKKDEAIIHQTNKFSIIKLDGEILHTIAGTIASIITKSKKFPNEHIILSIAKTPYDTMKASIRISKNGTNIDLRDVIKKIIELTGEGEAGGHVNAAGAVIPAEFENKFIENAKKVLEEL